MKNERRLIDVNKPIKETESIINFRKQHYMPTEDYESFLDYLKKLSTVDAVEVVRCRDCKHQIERGYAQYRLEGKNAEAMVHYLSGVVDMTGALIHHLEEKED